MDPDVMKALAEAWERVGPGVLGDANELAARKARRRLDFMMRPARAWCLAVRACDTRITPTEFEMCPQRPVVWDEENRRKVYREHTVVLEKRVLRWLCRPVTIPFPGLMGTEVEELLGTNETAVRAARRRGVFSVRYIRGLGGRRGPATPVLYTRRLLDPGGVPVGTMAEAEWGTSWRFVSDHIPDDLSQALVRRPVFRRFRVEQFVGWRWVCPGCKRLTRLVFCPMPHVVAAFVPRDRPDSPDGLESFPSVFGCNRCIRVKSCPRSSIDHWAEVVARLSGGLLYGHEVARPEWWQVSRRREFVRRPNRARSRRKAEVEKLLVETDWTRRRIAQWLGISRGCVDGRAAEVYKRRGVGSREELRRVAGSKEEGLRAAG